MKKSTLLIVVVIIISATLNAQVKIGNTGVPNAAAVLELDGGTNKGFLMPRLTNAQMTGITSPPNGLMVYNSTENNVYLRSGGVWRPVPDGNNPHNCRKARSSIQYAAILSTIPIMQICSSV